MCGPSARWRKRLWKEFINRNRFSSEIAAILALTFSFLWGARSAEALHLLDPNRYYLGTSGQPEWEEFSGNIPHARRLDIRFISQTNLHEATLFL